MQQSISVEIFRDVTTPDVDVQLAHEGLSVVNNIVKNLEVVRDNRRLNIGGTALSAVSDHIRWPRLDHDLTIVLTNRLLGMSLNGSNYIKEGYSQKLHQQDRAIAVISSIGTDPISTVTHETGHMLGLRYPGYIDENHCDAMQCVMHRTHQSSFSVERVKKTGLDGWLERQGLRVADYVEKTTSSSTEFCTPCGDQLARRSYFLLQHKQGKVIPESLR